MTPTPGPGPTDAEIALYVIGGVLGVLVIAFVILAACFCRWKTRLDEEEAKETAAADQEEDIREDITMQNDYGADPMEMTDDFYRYRMAVPGNSGIPAGVDYRALPTAYSNGYAASSRVPSIDQGVVYSARESSGVTGVQQLQVPVIPRDEQELVRQGVLLPAHGHDPRDQRAYVPRYLPPPGHGRPTSPAAYQRASLGDLQGYPRGGASMYAHSPANPVGSAPHPSIHGPASPVHHRQMSPGQATRPISSSSIIEPAQYRSAPAAAPPVWMEHQMLNRSGARASLAEPEAVVMRHKPPAGATPSWINHEMAQPGAGMIHPRNTTMF